VEKNRRNGPAVVGIGASAGGLDALEKFFAGVPVDTGLAFVVVQHTSPRHKSLLASLLQRITTLPVRDAINGTVLEPDTVHVMPTHGDLTLVQGCLHFRPRAKSSLNHLPIDVFFHSLAQDQAPHCAGVVLSGMGQDGSLGLQAIHAQGGWCLAQLPETAAYSAMPEQAIATGCVDAVLAPQDMAQALVKWTTARNLSRPSTGMPDPSEAVPAESLEAIVRLLQQHNHHDFSLYKPSTLQRRVERRMHLHQMDEIGAYVLHLQDNPQELALLFEEMLIGVTAFFRDPEVWQELSEKVLCDLVQKSTTRAIRAWVLGCSTGEEAYSLAMALQEAQDGSDDMSHTIHDSALQIFATDLNPAAIRVARKGWYSAQSLRSMSAQRLSRFFTPHDHGFQIHPALRAQVMFARHDVIVDPPFTQLDLLMCRNVLIYFNAALQKRLVPLFHYSLRAGGTLVLGHAETAGRAQNLFTPLHALSRIYRRNALNLVPGSVEFPVRRRTEARLNVQESSMPSSPSGPTHNLQTMADQVLLQAFSPAAVLVNATGDILYVSGRTGRFLEPTAGKANWNLHVMVRPQWRTPLGMALRQALEEGQPVVLPGLALEDDPHRQLQVTVHPLHEPQPLVGLAMVVFKEVATAVPSADTTQVAHQTMDALVQNTQQEMQALRCDMQASKDEMQALNEALRTSNEELLSSNEELTTSKEEAQSMNEELQTINSELQSRLDDLALAQSDMQNLLNSTEIATLFLDNELNVRRYTEQAVGIFHLREADVGRPLSDLANTLDYPDLQADVKETLRTLEPCTKSVVAADGRWFSVRILPYRTLANMVHGAVLTFVDISAAKALEFRLREAQLPATALKITIPKKT
jgi:two-component system CheB/CheR fusion protein